MYASHQNPRDGVFRTTDCKRGARDAAEGDGITGDFEKRQVPMRRFFGKIMLCRRRGYL